MVKTKGYLAVSVSVIATIALSILSIQGNQQAIGALMYAMTGILSFYFGMEGAQSSISLSGENGTSLEQEIGGVSVKAILSLVIGFAVTGVLCYLALIGNSRAVGAVIAELSVVTGYYFGDESVKRVE